MFQRTLLCHYKDNRNIWNIQIKFNENEWNSVVTILKWSCEDIPPHQDARRNHLSSIRYLSSFPILKESAIDTTHLGFSSKCPEGDSNPHILIRRQILNLLRLPLRHLGIKNTTDFRSHCCQRVGYACSNVSVPGPG